LKLGHSKLQIRTEASELGHYPRAKVMEWFSQKTSIAGIEIPNWVFVLGAIIVILLIYRFM
jgi:hypothetical protein